MSSRNNPARVAIVMGSKSDWATMQFAAEIFEILDVPHHVEVVSAHRTPDKLFSFAETAEENGYQVIIAGAGGAFSVAARRDHRQMQVPALPARVSSIRDNAPIHAGFPHRFTYPLTAVTFGPIAPSALANGASSSGEA